MDKNLLKIMLRDHKKINLLLSRFEELTKKGSNLEAKSTLNKFKWETEKHFFVEEKIIFSFAEEDFIFNLIKQHKDILFLIKKIEGSDYLEKLTEELKKLITEHISFENNDFYPKLENSLNQEQKDLIMDRANEIL